MKLALVGDISLHGLNPENIELDDQIISYFRQSDLIVGNLETPVTSSNTKTDLLPVHLKANNNAISFLKYFSVLSLCNNHIFDYGLEGFLDTFKLLDENQIKHFGAGRNLAEAVEPLKLTLDEDEKIAFISGTRWSNANKTSFGTASYKGHKSNIKKLKKEGYFIVYFPHWGYEYITIAPPDVRQHAKKMIDNGVDVIIGTHPHILQGYESYKGKHIFYSLGNFTFSSDIIKTLAPAESISSCHTTVILNLIIEKNNDYKFELAPVRFNNEKIELLSGVDKNFVNHYLEEISKIYYKSYTAYLREYYDQVPELVMQNIKIRNNFQNFHKQCLIRKLQLLKNITKQDVLNRLYNLTK
jgi:poly-gamma-glutamate synthesis protein (capsule biosynthesis protein)